MPMSTCKTLQLCLFTASPRFTKVTVMIFIAFSLLTGGLVSFVFSQTKPGGQETARLIKRYEQPASQYRIVEDTLEIRSQPDASKRKLVAIRICSKQPLSFALFQAAIDPFETAKYLKDYYAYAPHKIFFLRSEQCVSSGESKTEAAEIWIASREEALPQSVESLRVDQVNRSSLGTQPTNRGVRDYQAAVQTLIKRLRSNPDSRGVIIGYYLDHPNPLLRKRIHEAERLLKQSGVPPQHYYALLSQWHEGDSSYPNSEPRYPNVFIVETTKSTAARPR
jgi:hypothetical protein